MGCVRISLIARRNRRIRMEQAAPHLNNISPTVGHLTVKA
jgi:hypothetical protein